jgi:hypothetical protein
MNTVEDGKIQLGFCAFISEHDCQDLHLSFFFFFFFKYGNEDIFIRKVRLISRA